jgi:adenylyl- and sulfurtransferase ThiI
MIDTRPLIEINKEAIRILSKEIGVVDTVRFVNQFTTGYGNYTEEREEQYRDMSLDSIISAIKQERKKT